MQNINLDSINLDLVVSIVEAIQLVKQVELSSNNDDNANKSFIDELAADYTCFDLEDFDSAIDWANESDDMKVFYMIFTDAIRAFVDNDVQAFEVLGTDQHYSTDSDGHQHFAAQLVFRLNGDTLTVSSDFVQSNSGSCWEVDRYMPISYKINDKVIDVNDPISDDFDELAKSWIMNCECLKKPDTRKFENAKSLLNENKALVELLPRIAS